jgi:hypothetical protein
LNSRQASQQKAFQIEARFEDGERRLSEMQSLLIALPGCFGIHVGAMSIPSGFVFVAKHFAARLCIHVLRHYDAMEQSLQSSH